MTEDMKFELGIPSEEQLEEMINTHIIKLSNYDLNQALETTKAIPYHISQEEINAWFSYSKKENKLKKHGLLLNKERV